MASWVRKLLRLEMSDDDKAQVRLLILDKPAAVQAAYFGGTDADALAVLRELLHRHVAEPGIGWAGWADKGTCRTGTRMMGALRALLPAELGPGAVLHLGCGLLFHPEYKSLFVRSCYGPLFDAALRAEGHRVIVAGTPGIGKSWFLYFILAKLMTSTAVPPHIVCEQAGEPETVYCYDTAEGVLWVGDRFHCRDRLANPATWYICDGVLPQPNSVARMVLLTSTNKADYRAFYKQPHKLLYMPVWPLDELRACRSVLYKGVPMRRVQDLYDRYGGVARYVLEHPSVFFSASLEDMLKPLLRALAICNTAQVQTAICDDETSPESSHGVLHIIASADFCWGLPVFASRWVAEQFVQKAIKAEVQGLGRLLSNTSGALRGMLHECAMHAVLPQGGGTTVVQVSQDKLARGNEKKLTTKRCKETRFIKALKTFGEAYKPGVYHRPSRAAFPGIDSLRSRETRCDLFQMTVGGSEVVDGRALSSLLTQLQLPPNVAPRLYFVVPDDVYPEFRLMAGTDWPPQPRDAAFACKLYIMKGQYGRLQESALNAVPAAGVDKKRKAGSR